jgi:hypothetical protein
LFALYIPPVFFARAQRIRPYTGPIIIAISSSYAIVMLLGIVLSLHVWAGRDYDEDQLIRRAAQSGVSQHIRMTDRNRRGFAYDYHDVGAGKHCQRAKESEEGMHAMLCRTGKVVTIRPLDRKHRECATKLGVKACLVEGKIRIEQASGQAAVSQAAGSGRAADTREDAKAPVPGPANGRSVR